LIVDSFVPLFENAELDTGWQPKDGLLSVRFQVDADGGADVAMDGTSTLTWPDDLNLNLYPTPGTGFVDVVASLGVVISLKFDIDIYRWESEIANESVSVLGGTIFEPFLLEGGDDPSLSFTSQGTEESVFEYTYDVLSGVASVGFFATLQPRNNTVFNGIGWLVGSQLVTQADAPIVIPPEGQPAIETEATYLSSWSNDLDLVFVPTFQVCIIALGCYDWDITELGLDLATEQFEHAFPAVPLYFPLPVLDIDDAMRDFGGVEVGNLSNVEIPLSNLGELFLEGTASIEGSSAFTVYPDYFLAIEAATDGVVITFMPDAAGVTEATLVIESNDPQDPVLEIVLRGEGLSDAAGPGGNGGNGGDVQSEVVKSGCGCASLDRQSATGGAALLFGLLGLTLRRRKKI
jgi:MYXO-CTERM domain-containing protein